MVWRGYPSSGMERLPEFWCVRYLCCERLPEPNPSQSVPGYRINTSGTVPEKWKPVHRYIGWRGWSTLQLLEDIDILRIIDYQNTCRTLRQHRESTGPSHKTRHASRSWQCTTIADDTFHSHVYSTAGTLIIYNSYKSMLEEDQTILDNKYKILVIPNASIS